MNLNGTLFSRINANSPIHSSDGERTTSARTRSPRNEASLGAGVVDEEMGRESASPSNEESEDRNSVHRSEAVVPNSSSVESATGSGESCNSIAHDSTGEGSETGMRASKRRRVDCKSTSTDTDNASLPNNDTASSPTPMRGARTRRLADGERGIEVKKDKVIPEEITNPIAPVHLSMADRSPPLIFLPAAKDDNDATGTLPRVSGYKGFRSVRASHGVTTGCWYFEVVIRSVPEGCAVRLGWSTRRLDVETPVGFSKFSFGIRDRTGEFIHAARLKPYGEKFGAGDVVGCLIVLPAALSNNLRTKIDKAEEAWLHHKYVNYGSGKHQDNDMLPFEKSHCRWYKNGVDFGIPDFFNKNKKPADKDDKSDEMIAGVYYPTVSLFRDAQVAVNFGPDFKHDLPEGAQAYCEVAPVALGENVKAPIAVGEKEKGTGDTVGASSAKTDEMMASPPDGGNAV